MNNLRRVLHQLAKQQNAVGMGTRHGYVHEIQDQGGERKVRVVLGMQKDGTPWLSPWLHAEEQAGGTQEQHLVEKGMNVIVTAHGGDFRNGTFSHSAPSKSFPQPPHAPKVNGYTSAHGKLRTSHNKPKSSSSGGGSNASLAGTTEVQTPEGFKNIQQLQLGDLVVSYNTSTDKPEVDLVVGIHVEITEKKMLVLAYPGGRIHCTEDHLIWSEKRRNYIYANQLYFNETLRNHLGIAVAESVKDLEVPPNTRVYHLTIKNNHNFFVREAGSESMLLVHNQGGGGGGGDDSHYHSVEIVDQDQNNPQHQEQSGQPQQGGGGGQSGQQQGGGQKQQDNAKAVVSNRTHEKNGCTGRVGSDDQAARYASHEKGAKIRIASNFIFVTKQGCFSSKPIQLMPKDPIPNDNA